MKNKLTLLLALFASSTAFGQLFQAAITKSASPNNSVDIYVRPSSNVSGKISSMSVALAIPTAVGTRPTVAVDNSPNTAITWVIYNAVNQNVNGVPHYIYNLLGDGNVGAVIPATNFLSAGTGTLVVKASFSGSTGNTSLIKMVNLPDGGSDPNPNSFFGFSLDILQDPVNETNMFYVIPTLSTANNEVVPGGYSGLSWGETTGLVVVPVKFTSFTATRKDNDGLLTWSVENESALTDRYEVERSLNGTNFTTAYTVAAKNNGASSNIYNLTDFNLSGLRSSGVIYYRIKQIDKDGKFTYTEIRSIRLEGKGAVVINIYPNPVKDVATVMLDLEQDVKVVIAVADAAGKQIQKIEFQGIKGMNTKKVNMLNLPSGTYAFRITAGADTKAISVVKQ